MSEETMEMNQKAPVIVNLGKNSRKRIKKLKRGEGSLMLEVQQKLSILKSGGQISADAEPVVFVVEKRAEMSIPWMPSPRCFSMK
jgi:hypothetical protein